MISISVSSSGGGLEDLQRKLRTLSRPVGKAGTLMGQETRKNFSSQSDPDGNAWAGLAASTLKQKGGGRILTRTGALRGSVKVRRGGLTATVSVGTSYAQYHQNGTSKMPQRKIIGIGARHIPMIRELFEAHFNG